jgi:predicted Zn-dependent protease
LQSQLAMWVIKALVYDDQDDEQETFGEALGELLAQSAVYLGQQRYSRRDEYEADATSWDLLVHGKYNPQSLHSLLSKLWSLEKSGSDNSQQTSAIQEWTRTHPATKDRLEALDRKWELLPASERRRLARNPI